MRKMQVDPNFHYFVNGENPRLLIHSGTHGDEYDVIGLVTEALEKYEGQLPEFLFVPMVSPSAVRAKTRTNNLGNDLNRVFFSDSPDQEILTNIDILKSQKFDLFVSFHEDPEFSEYYVYDVGYRPTHSELVIKHNQHLRDKGVSLFTGIDDPTDPDLGYEFEGGYRRLFHPADGSDDGSISSWVLNRHIADEYLLPEIPQKLEEDKKRFIVDSFFKEVILKYFEN